MKSPWRYPGAKSRHLHILEPHLPAGGSYCEPFVGGGSVALYLAAQQMLDGQVEQFILNDADPRVAAWWQVVCGPDDGAFRTLVEQVTITDATVSEFDKQKRVTQGQVELAFSGFFLNRTAYSGSLTAGPIGGREQKSEYTVDCRWEPARSVREMQRVRDAFIGRTTVTDVDFREVLDGLGEEVFVYADPPYVHAGPAAYSESFTEDDHESLAERLLRRGNWVLTYDDHPLVRALYTGRAKIEEQTLRYSMHEKGHKVELVITPSPA